MKYLFFILLAFSFLGCDPEEASPSKTIYATFTIPTNTENIWQMSVACGTAQAIENSGNYNSPLPSGTPITTDSFVLSNFPANIVCSISLVGQTNGNTNIGQNTDVEINLYVDDQLYETRVVTGQGYHNFIVE